VQEGVACRVEWNTAGMEPFLIVLAVLVFLGLVTAARGLRVIQQYERGVVFRLGKVGPEPLGPGLNLINPITDRVVKVNMQIIAMGVPAQEGITRDNISVRVDAVVYFRVMDPIKATVNVQNYMYAVSQVAQTSLRSVIGRSDLDQLLGERERINAILRDELDEPTEGPWGVRIERVEIKDVTLPESMKRSMSRQAEAERERRARVITADGEFQASKKLAQAARLMAADPAAMQLRLLQTVTEVAAEKNSTLVMPFPVELLRFFEHAAGGAPAAPAAQTAAQLEQLATLGDQADAEIAGLEMEPLDVPPVVLPELDIPELEAVETHPSEVPPPPSEPPTGNFLEG
jgi:regulator of protease activity HflC (stomatin/prohibitin superfamily)